MEKFLVSTLGKGKYFSHPLYLEEKYILLSPEVPVSDLLINRLQRWNYSYVFSQGEQVDGIAGGNNDSSNVEVSVNLDYDAREQTEFAKAFDFYKSLVSQTETLFADFINKNVLSLQTVTNLVKLAIETIKEQRQYLLRLTEMHIEDMNYLVVHSVRSLLLSISLGQVFKLPPHKLLELAMAGLLNEIGMIKLPSQLYSSNKILTPQERKAVSAHTVLGFKILKSAGFPMSVCLAVLESHENMDGSGYPRNLSADKISLYAKIIGVASSYAALTSPRPFRHAFDGHSSIVELLKGMGRRYDEHAVRGLVSLLSIFPIGTWVQLANGSIGMVTATNDQNPKEPFVRIKIGPSGEKFADAVVVRTDAIEYRIARAMSVPQTNEIKRNNGF